MMVTRGIRGATSVEEDSLEGIIQATSELLKMILQANPSLQPQDLVSIIFTMTDDLNSTYPALAARQLGWIEVPLLCAREISVPGGMPRVIRVLMHWNTDLPQSNVHHVYLGRAEALRPDLEPIHLPLQDAPIPSIAPFAHNNSPS
jgi:chorismate mutase